MKLDRLLDLVRAILERDKTSVPELAIRFNVSVRTIHRDLEIISQAGIPVVTCPGANGGVGILNIGGPFSCAKAASLLLKLNCKKDYFAERAPKRNDASPLPPDSGTGRGVMATLRVTENGKRFIRERFGDGVLARESASSWLARVSIPDGEPGYRFALSLGTSCEVLSPASLRAGMRDYLQTLCAAYA